MKLRALIVKLDVERRSSEACGAISMFTGEEAPPG